MKQPTWCFNCDGKGDKPKPPSIRYGYAPPIYVGRDGAWYEVSGTSCMCDKCGHEWKLYEYPVNGR